MRPTGRICLLGRAAPAHLFRARRVITFPEFGIAHLPQGVPALERRTVSRAGGSENWYCVPFRLRHTPLPITTRPNDFNTSSPPVFVPHLGQIRCNWGIFNRRYVKPRGFSHVGKWRLSGGSALESLARVRAYDLLACVPLL
jgi:hypothetical protein